MNEAPVVVGVDGSPASLAALRWAVTEAAATGREVRAIAAWSYAPALEPGGARHRLLRAGTDAVTGLSGARR